MSGDGVRPQAVFGGADGLTLGLGLIVSLAGQPQALVHAGFGAGLAELVGMAAGVRLSDPSAGWKGAAANGLSGFGACVLPALPYLASSGTAALAASVALIVTVAGVIAWLRPEHGLRAVTQTYGILAAAAVLCWGASLL